MSPLLDASYSKLGKNICEFDFHFVKKYPTKDLTLTRIQIHENDLESDIRIVNLVGTGIFFNW